jgi:hypothetical protein
MSIEEQKNKAFEQEVTSRVGVILFELWKAQIANQQLVGENRQLMQENTQLKIDLRGTPATVDK